MVYYQKTPARIIFEMAAHMSTEGNPVFYDMGAGLGQVCILISLLSGIKAIGVEMEPEFCAYARQSAQAFNLHDVEFMNRDVRSLSYGDGTDFYLYTPFTGSILKAVIEILHEQARHRVIRIFTFGLCTHEFAKLNWLRCMIGDPDLEHILAGFESIPL
jgi:SAM-dependent methyltransferase